MDWIDLKQKLSALLGKYRYVLLIVVVGLTLMSIPEKEKVAQPLPEASAQETANPEAELEEILSQIQGVGKVKVMLTEAEGSLTEYQTDRDTSADGALRSETVLISGESREERGLVRSVTPPTYLGAIVVCQGGDNASVRYALIQAVSSVTGLSSDRIMVLKMK